MLDPVALFQRAVLRLPEQLCLPTCMESWNFLGVYVPAPHPPTSRFVPLSTLNQGLWGTEDESPAPLY